MKSHSLVGDKSTHQQNAQLVECSDTLLHLPGLPLKLKRDLQSITSTAIKHDENTLFRLLKLYQQAIKIIAYNPTHHRLAPEHDNNGSIFQQLNRQLQDLITELDFDGEAGDLLFDIRNQLLLGVDNQTLMELALQVLRLVIDGTRYERQHSTKFLAQLNASLSKSLTTSQSNILQSKQYQHHRHTLHQELAHLIAHGKQKLSAQRLKHPEFHRDFSDIVVQIEQVSQRLTHAEQREQLLIDRLDYAHHHIEELNNLTQDYRRRLEDQEQRLLQDPLTKLYNRSAFNDRLELEYRRWIRAQHNLRLVKLDIDAFKTINQRFGYSAGDKALKVIARAIHKSIEKTETAARFSGEEFMLILPERSDEECLALIKNIQNTIAKLPFKFRDQPLTITLSGSSSAFQETDTPEIVLERLHRGLEKIKPSGPNQLNWQ